MVGLVWLQRLAQTHGGGWRRGESRARSGSAQAKVRYPEPAVAKRKRGLVSRARETNRAAKYLTCRRWQSVPYLLSTCTCPAQQAGDRIVRWLSISAGQRSKWWHSRSGCRVGA